MALQNDKIKLELEPTSVSPVGENTQLSSSSHKDLQEEATDRAPGKSVRFEDISDLIAAEGASDERKSWRPLRPSSPHPNPAAGKGRMARSIMVLHATPTPLPTRDLDSGGASRNAAPVPGFATENVVFVSGKADGGMRYESQGKDEVEKSALSENSGIGGGAFSCLNNLYAWFGGI